MPFTPSWRKLDCIISYPRSDQCMICDGWLPVNPGVNQNVLAALLSEIIKNARQVRCSTFTSRDPCERHTQRPLIKWTAMCGNYDAGHRDLQAQVSHSCDKIVLRSRWQSVRSCTDAQESLARVGSKSTFQSPASSNLALRGFRFIRVTTSVMLSLRRSPWLPCAATTYRGDDDPR